MQEEEARDKRTVRFNFAIQDLEKYMAQGKELGVLLTTDLEEGELEDFEQRATGWPYMLDMEDPNPASAVGRYSSTKSKKLQMPDGKWYSFDSQLSAMSLGAILLKSQTKVAPYTHVDMMGERGGRFYIAANEEEAEALGRPLWATQRQFLRLYALATLHGHKTWLIEQHTPLKDAKEGNLMVYFMDLDFGQPDIIKPKTIEVLIFIIVRSLKKFFPGASEDLLQCICATTTCKIERCQACLCSQCSSQPEKHCEECSGMGNTGKNKSGNACATCGGQYPVKKKTGLHLHFPNIVLSTSQALDIRQTMIAECTRLWGVRAPPFNSWEDVFDRSVYEKSGLRMIGANKGEICKSCKGGFASKKDPLKIVECATCQNRRRIDQGRPYFPIACFGGNGKRDKTLEIKYESDFCLLIEHVSIRAHGKEITPGYALYEGAPTDVTRIRVGKKRARSLEGGPATPASSTAAMPPDAPEVSAIQSFFTDKNVQNLFCPAKYGELVVSQVKVRQRGGMVYKVDVTGANSRFCMNKDDYHGGNRIYFEFRAATKDTAQGVVQRCYCEKAEVRKYGTCAEYASRPMQLPEAIARALFPRVDGEAPSCKTSEVGKSEGGSVLSRLDVRSMSMTSRTQAQMLLKAGNLLVRQLFGAQQQWTTSPRFQAMYGKSMLQAPMARRELLPHFRAVKLDRLGPLDTEVMINLGFLAKDKSEEDVQKVKASPTLRQLQQALASTTNHILNVVLHANEEQVLEVLATKSFSALKKLICE